MKTVQERIPDAATARRCINAVCDFLSHRAESPLASADLQHAIELQRHEVRAQTLTDVRAIVERMPSEHKIEDLDGSLVTAIGRERLLDSLAALSADPSVTPDGQG